MKTAISVPGDLFEKAESLARRDRRSRSELYSTALREYLARHSPDEVTEAFDRLCGETGTKVDGFVAEASRRVLRKVEW